ncbi:MAG: sodium:proton antiporter [Cyanobacteria bacterium P01_A01_bin.37]
MSLYIFSLLVIGLVLLTVTLGSGWIARLPVSYALIYLLVGVFLGPYGIDFLANRPSTEFIERLTEFVVIVSVFGCGLKMNRPMTFAAWQTPARLIGFLMPLSIVAIALSAHFFLKFDWGAAILLGAILAPTDPVLASEVQIAHSDDQDDFRFGITSEGGLNDSLAFPFVYFGIKVIENPDWSSWFRQWLLIDVVWAIAAGIAMGFVVAKGILWIDGHVQRSQPAKVLMEDLVALSTILLTYSLTELINGYGFLAVFVAGLTVRKHYHIEHHRKKAQMHLIEQVEKLLEVVAILLLGSLLRINAIGQYLGDALIISGFLLLVIRPLGTQLSFIGSPLPASKRWLTGWFGIRGLGSLYYLSYAMGKGLSGGVAERLAWIVYIVIALSICLHGLTASPLMGWYRAHKQANQEAHES